MCAWIEVGEEIAKAEFPNYELLQSLTPLDLKAQLNAFFGRSSVEENLSRLCKVLAEPEIC